MATRRISSRRGLGATLVANPSRNSRGQFTRNPRGRTSTPRRRNPYGASTKKGGLRMTSRKAYVKRKRNPRRRNPGMGGFSIAGVPVVNVALGGLGALVIANTLKNIPSVEKQLASYENKSLAAAIPSAITLGVSAMIHKYAKGQFKVIAKWMVAASAYKLVDDATDTYFKNEFPKMFGDEGKVNADANKAAEKAKETVKKDVKDGAANGMFGGAYMPLAGPTGGQLGGAYLDLSTGGTSSHATSHATFGIH